MRWEFRGPERAVGSRERHWVVGEGKGGGKGSHKRWSDGGVESDR